MLQQSLKEHLPEGIQWVEPKGGFYMWLTLPDQLNAATVFLIA